jgi:predicted NAD/FAD-dependent oxidoreductase
MDVIVIGAGMAGVRAAALRARAGDRVIVLDKGRRHGGRMATRRVDDATFDTGVLDLSAHGPSFAAALEGWSEAGAAERTGAEHAGAEHTGAGRWRGRPTMRSLPAALAEGCGAEVRLATTVTALSTAEGRWQVTLGAGSTSDEGGAELLSADALVVTAPAPQTLALLRSGAALASDATLCHLEQVTYVPSLVALVRPLDRSLGSDDLAPADVDSGSADIGGGSGDLIRIHRNDLTGGSAVVALTLQGSATFSAEHFDGDRAAAARLLADEASRRIGIDLEVVHVHGWRYAQVAAGIPLPALRDDTAGAPLVLAGDLFEARGDAPDGVRPQGVERAYASGGAGARLLEGAPDGR